MSLFGTYINKDNKVNNEAVETSAADSNMNKIPEKTNSLKEESVMDNNNYGIITNEDGSKELIELSEAEMAAVLEAREYIEEAPRIGETSKDAVKRAGKEAGAALKNLGGELKDAGKAAGKELGRKAKMAGTNIKGNAERLGKKAHNLASDVGAGISKAGEKIGLKAGQLNKIIVAVGAAVAAGVSIAAIVKAINDTKGKNQTAAANESVMFTNEDGNSEILEITNEEYEALVETRLEMDEENICRLTLTNEEYEAIMEARSENNEEVESEEQA